MQLTLELKLQGFLLTLNMHIMKYVYESPDNGRTVYKREPGSPDRVVVKDETEQEHDATNRWTAWRDILRAAKHNPALSEALDRAQIIYELSRQDQIDKG